MACEQSAAQLHAYFDGELPSQQVAAFEAHLQTCPDCAAALAREEATRAAISKSALYERPPLAVRQQIRAALPAPPPPRAYPRRVWLVPALAAVCIFIMVLSWSSIPRPSHLSPQSPLILGILDAHLRSLQPGHLADVESTDQHTVKPWFDGKLDFAPPVRDFSAQGFPLLGGRLDILEGRTVAALVYGRRKHFINVFVWPAGNASADSGSGERLGYRYLAWQSNGFEFCAISDTSPADLAELQQLIAAP